MKELLISLMLLSPDQWLDFSKHVEVGRLVASVEAPAARRLDNYPAMRRAVFRAIAALRAQMILSSDAAGCASQSGDADAWWKMDDAASGDRVDSSSNGNTLSDNNGVGLDTTNKQEGTGAADYDNTSGQRVFMTDANMSAGTVFKNGTSVGAVTIRLWARLTADDNPRVFHKGSSNIQFNSGPGTIVVQIDANSNETAASNGNWSTSTWYHVLGMYEGSEVAQWLDDVKQTDTTAATGDIDTSTQNLSVADVPFTGQIDGLAIFPSSRTEAQRTCLYNSGVGGDGS